MTLFHPHKSLIKINMKKKLSNMIKFKRISMIKGGVRTMRIIEKHHHIEECTKMVKEITPSTTYLMILRKW
jgi:hypothetical protein